MYGGGSKYIARKGESKYIARRGTLNILRGGGGGGGLNISHGWESKYICTEGGCYNISQAGGPKYIAQRGSRSRSTEGV